MNVYIKYGLLVILDTVSLLSSFIAVPILSIFTKAQPDLDEEGEAWGWLYGTWDNPPQGDEKWQRECYFPHITTGFKGYINRVGWLFRNPCYGFQKKAGIPYDKMNVISCEGNENISDKYEIAGKYFATVKDTNGKVLAFEYYIIKPWTILPWKKCQRYRLGWKIMTDKYERYGFATLVDTINPMKSFGK